MLFLPTTTHTVQEYVLPRTSRYLCVHVEEVSNNRRAQGRLVGSHTPDDAYQPNPQIVRIAHQPAGHTQRPSQRSMRFGQISPCGGLIPKSAIVHELPLVFELQCCSNKRLQVSQERKCGEARRLQEHGQLPQGHHVWMHKALAKQCKRFVPGIFVS